MWKEGKKASLFAMRVTRGATVFLLFYCAFAYAVPDTHPNRHQEGQEQRQSSENGCPRDSVPSENDGCKCVPTCPPASCKPGERAIEVSLAASTGACCPLYECVASESVYWADREEGGSVGYCVKNGMFWNVGQQWKEGPCVNCTCMKNNQVSCQAIMCKSCENPIPPDPGECCSHCPQPTNNLTIVDIGSKPSCGTSLSDCNLNCYHGYANDEDGCPICECTKQSEDEVVHPATEDNKICPELHHCDPNCDVAKDETGCPVCSCLSPSPLVPTTTSRQHELNESLAITNRPHGYRNPENYENDNDKKIVCPEVKCDLHCEHGLLMDDNDCTLCECKPLHNDCPPLVGCKKKCRFGYKTNKRGCLMCRCRANCINDQNEPIPEGSTWLRNACTTCTCEVGGRVNCKETVCSVACSDPLPPEPYTCCPVCPITVTTENETSHQTSRGWGVIPITVIVVLAFLCLLLIIHIVRNRFRARLSPSDGSYSYPPQYYKCVPVYDTPMHRNEKIVPL